MKDEKPIQLSLFNQEEQLSKKEGSAATAPSALPESANEEWKGLYDAISHYASQLKPKE